MLATTTVPDQSMGGLVGDAKIAAGKVGAEVPLRRDGLLLSAFAFELLPGNEWSMGAFWQQRFALGQGGLATWAILLRFGLVDEGLGA